jgi:DNA-binding NarL/FixJ family response regulator
VDQLSPDWGDPLREGAWASLIHWLDLSPREAEIARHLTAGHADKVIAKSLRISEEKGRKRGHH